MQKEKELNDLACASDFKYQTLARKVIENGKVPRNYFELDEILLNDVYVFVSKNSSTAFEFVSKLYPSIFETMYDIACDEQGLFSEYELAQGAILEFYLTPFTSSSAFPKMRRLVDTICAGSAVALVKQLRAIDYECNDFIPVTDEFSTNFHKFVVLVEAYITFRFR